ncbi:hypothetical protein [Halomonas sp.]|uniref:hypothetical protein n=1 Tax=Halomonas sp. TaxID=1486246 RepID=UPI003D10C23F
MRLVHLTVSRQLSQGQLKQLRFEYDAAKDLKNVEWITLAYHNSSASQPFVHQTPFIFRWIFFRKLWCWVVAIKLSRSCDLVMMRHITFDPFTFVFAPLIKNRISVHHSKEVEELKLIRKGWKGKAASWLEKVSGRFSVSRTKMILGVTQEIAEYERDLRAPDKPIDIYPNGVDVEKIEILQDKRLPNEVNAVFICGTFSAWHGLDKLVAAVDDGDVQDDVVSLTIHLIGKLSYCQMSEIQATEARRKIFKIHGSLSEIEYRPIMEKCDVGIASLAMERQSLLEGSTLKVREMLAMGMPIYSGHEDIALVKEEPFVNIVQNVCLKDILDFGLKSKSVTREKIRRFSRKRISKLAAMESLISNELLWIKKI